MSHWSQHTLWWNVDTSAVIQPRVSESFRSFSIIHSCPGHPAKGGSVPDPYVPCLIHGSPLLSHCHHEALSPVMFLTAILLFDWPASDLPSAVLTLAPHNGFSSFQTPLPLHLPRAPHGSTHFFGFLHSLRSRFFGGSCCLLSPNATDLSNHSPHLAARAFRQHLRMNVNEKTLVGLHRIS